MSDVGARVLARLDEVERDARRADGTDYVPTGMLDAPDVLRWVAAMRAVVEHCTATIQCAEYLPPGHPDRGYYAHLPEEHTPGCDGCAAAEAVAANDGHVLTALAAIWPEDEPAEPPESHGNGPRSAEPGSEVPQ